MKIGFNEGCNRFCENHSVLEDLDPVSYTHLTLPTT